MLGKSDFFLASYKITTLMPSTSHNFLLWIIWYFLLLLYKSFNDPFHIVIWYSCSHFPIFTFRLQVSVVRYQKKINWGSWASALCILRLLRYRIQLVITSTGRTFYGWVIFEFRNPLSSFISYCTVSKVSIVPLLHL